MLGALVTSHVTHKPQLGGGGGNGMNSIACGMSETCGRHSLGDVTDQAAGGRDP